MTIKVENNKVLCNKNGNKFIDLLGDLGWDYTCNRMSRSGMEIYDGIMRHCGILEETEHWNEDVYADANGDW